MSASDNLSTKCSGFLLHSSFAIFVARARHLFSVDSDSQEYADNTGTNRVMISAILKYRFGVGNPDGKHRRRNLHMLAYRDLTMDRFLMGGTSGTNSP
jgi:hypothetical protein